MKDNKFHLGEIQQRVEQAKKVLPRKIADESRSFMIKSFQQGGFNDTGTVQKWAEVDRRKPDTNAYKYPKTKKLSRRTKPILVGTGRLRNSVRISYVSFRRSVIMTDVPYARYLNEGTKYIKRRRFIGRSKILDQRVVKIIKKELTYALNVK